MTPDAAAGSLGTPYSADAWAALGTHRQLCGERIFTVDAAPLGPETLEPLLVLHGFPTSSYDYAAVLNPLRRHRRVLLLDMLGYGLSAKPDRHYTMALQADIAAAFVAELGVDRLALLTHDMGDTVGGELLARRADPGPSPDAPSGWPVDITRRVVTNGSIYIEQAHLTDGQLMLLGLADELLPEAFPLTADALAASLRATFSPLTPHVPAPWTEDPVAPAAAQIVHDDGQRVLPRLIRYIEERRANERRFTGAIEADPSPVHVVWGLDDPIAVPAMVDTLTAARPSATVERLADVGHYPMVEAPARFLDAVLPFLS
jgi:pimeloyl-ACP methyl ester carboxylesterase